MTTAEAEATGAAPDERPEGASEAPQAAAAEQAQTPAGPACANCGAALAPDQDWCLECGTAANPARRRPGLRSVGVAGALALLLTGGAVAASYAALTDEPPPRETKVTTVATAAPPAATPTTTTPPVEDVQPLPPADTQPVDPVEPVEPVTPVTPVQPTTTTPTTTTPKTEDEKPTQTAPEITPITLASGDGSLYDPDKRATASGDPARALDGNDGTSWFVTTPSDGDMNVGYVLDLGKSQQVKRLELVTRTPGFTIRVLGARGGKPPAASDDAAWVVLGEAGSVDAKPATGAAAPAVAPAEDDKPGDRRLKLDLAANDEIFRHVLLWVSAPPSAGPTARFSSIRLLH
jgi:hypothetical protein